MPMVMGAATQDRVKTEGAGLLVPLIQQVQVGHQHRRRQSLFLRECSRRSCQRGDGLSCSGGHFPQAGTVILQPFVDRLLLIIVQVVRARRRTHIRNLKPATRVHREPIWPEDRCTQAD